MTKNDRDLYNAGTLLSDVRDEIDIEKKADYHLGLTPQLMQRLEDIAAEKDMTLSQSVDAAVLIYLKSVNPKQDLAKEFTLRDNQIAFI